MLIHNFIKRHTPLHRYSDSFYIVKITKNNIYLISQNGNKILPSLSIYCEIFCSKRQTVRRQITGNYLLPLPTVQVIFASWILLGALQHLTSSHSCIVLNLLQFCFFLFFPFYFIVLFIPVQLTHFFSQILFYIYFCFFFLYLRLTLHTACFIYLLQLIFPQGTPLPPSNFTLIFIRGYLHLFLPLFQQLLWQT